MVPSGIDLSIGTFGGVTAVLADGQPARFHTNRARALLLYLVLGRGRVVHREAACAALWPGIGEAAARAQLRKTLWRIRSALRDASDGLLWAAEEQIRLVPQRVEADLWRLSDAVGEFDRAGGAAASLTALTASLDGLSGTFGAGVVDEWALEAGRALEQERLAAIERVVAQFQREGQFLQAVHWANRGLGLDPLAEPLHRAVMECHILRGDAPSALRQYRACRDLLATTLGIAPSPETVAVRDAVTAASTVRSAPVRGPCRAGAAPMPGACVEAMR